MNGKKFELAFCQACLWKGNVPETRRLSALARKQKQPFDVHTRNDLAWRWARAKGSPETARWLISHFGFSPNRLRYIAGYSTWKLSRVPTFRVPWILESMAPERLVQAVLAVCRIRSAIPLVAMLAEGLASKRLARRSLFYGQ